MSDKKEKKKEKKCVTFWIDKELIEKFDEMYFQKSYFIRECIRKALNDTDFYIDITTIKKD